jgi:hypothetical protein
MKYTELTFTELVNKIGSSRFFDLPKMLKEVLSRLSPQEPKYKVYTALLTQSGTNAPVATVLENTLGNIVWIRDGEGVYQGELAGAFSENKTFTIITNCGGQETNYYINDNNINYVGIATSDGVEYTDELLFKTPIEIRVYN